MVWKIIVCICCLVFTGCQNDMPTQLYNVLTGKDCKIPIFLGAEAIDYDVLTCIFDEPVYCEISDISIGQLNVIAVNQDANSITIQFDRDLLPGTQHQLSARVRDVAGNSLRFTTMFWACNPDMPEMVINEFSTKGNANHPDRIEILILSDGNIAGAALCDGIGPSFDSEFIFPSLAVERNDRIVVYYGEKTDQEQPLMFYGGTTGLGSNNGVLTLSRTSGTTIIDAVLYSNRTSESDVNYAGFGTKKVYERALLLEQSGQWLPSPIAPEHGIDSTYSTATRSLCRDELVFDSNSNIEWYVVPTGKASFGLPNCPDKHQP